MIQGVETFGSATEFSVILAHWIRAYEDASYAFPQKRDAWFVERTLVGLLASAAWLSGIPAVVEARAERPGTSSPKIDVLLKLNSGVAAIEAKIHYVPYETDAHKLVDQLDDALGEAAKVSHPLAKRYFGMSFVLLEAQQEETDLELVLRKTLSCARDHNPRPSGLAWILLDQPEAIYRGCVVAVHEAMRTAA